MELRPQEDDPEKQRQNPDVTRFAVHWIYNARSLVANGGEVKVAPTTGVVRNRRLIERQCQFLGRIARNPLNCRQRVFGQAEKRALRRHRTAHSQYDW